MKQFIILIKKFWTAILVIILFTAVSSVIFGYQFNKTSVSNTIFINIGATGNKDISPFETVQAADHMSESFMGWLKNPAFLDKILTQTDFKPGISVRRQEKQNLVLTYKTPDTELGKKVSSSIEENLRAYIGKFNLETSGLYKMTIYEHSYEENPVPILLFAIFGVIAGSIIGLALASFWNLFMKEWHENHH